MPAMRMEQLIRIPFGSIQMLSSTPEQMEEIANEIAELAQNGILNSQNRHRGNIGNLFNSSLFRECAEGVHRRTKESRQQYSLSPDFELLCSASEVRRRIEQVLKTLKRTERARPCDIFSARFLKEFDWIEQHRKQAVSFALARQKDFVEEPCNPMLLNDLKQQDIADAIGLHLTTIGRLIKNITIEFTDSVVRDFAILVPGASLTFLKGCYSLGLLAKDQKFFDAKGGWKISDDDLVEVLKRDFGIEIAHRTVRKYRKWVDDHLLKPRRHDGNEENPTNLVLPPPSGRQILDAGGGDKEGRD